MEARLKRLQQSLKCQKLSSLLVSNLLNIKYLTGFSCSNGYLVVLQDETYLYVDSRYYERACKEVKGICVRLLDEKWPLPLQKMRIKKLRFEADSVPYGIYMEWKKRFKGIALIPAKNTIENLRMVKDKYEIEAIRKSVRFTDKILSLLKIRHGISEIELTHNLENIIREDFRSVPSFNPIIAFGANSSIPHAVPKGKRIKNNEIALIDMGIVLNGYSSDLTRTFFMGKITRKFEQIYNTVLTAQCLAIGNIKPGVKAKDIDSAARNYIKDKGFGGYFGHSLGHGIGISVHELPRISWKSDEVLKEGMVFSVEPGVYMPGWGGIRIEDLVLVTENGCEVLSKSPKELVDIEL
jgi:Xaa-Pro aminopeptidase